MVYTLVEGWWSISHFAATGLGHLAVELTINSSDYQSILELSVRLAKLKLSWNWFMRQDNDAKYSSKSIIECLKQEKSKCFNGPAKIQTSNLLKCCGITVRELCINDCLQTSVNWSDVVRRSGPKFLHRNVSDW